MFRKVSLLCIILQIGVSAYADPVLIAVKTEHIFSSSTTKDHFKISLTGRSILAGKIRLDISTHNKQLIFTDSFPATDLLWDNDEANLTDQEKEAIIRKRITDFFSDSCFICPAIKIATPFQTDNSDRNAWQDIGSDKEAIGFAYSHGYEGTYAIAYSKKKKKVLLYFSTD